ncbi:hypothetical protein [Fodinicurvata sediminis]|uniref:hypothetical protein n=1 Tax=Fodinicurvata sediminis TaxID=1121832 RepID=UPI0003B6C82A|nr:hypothetical protein [Fodinicurvata sediminis]
MVKLSLGDQADAGKTAQEQRIIREPYEMTFAHILVWSSSAGAVLASCLLGLNLAYSGRRINRPKALAAGAGDLLVLCLALAGMVSIAGVIYLTLTSSTWPVFIIVSGLALLAAPLLHQVLPIHLRDRLGGAVALAAFCLFILLLQVFWMRNPL